MLRRCASFRSLLRIRNRRPSTVAIKARAFILYFNLGSVRLRTFQALKPAWIIVAALLFISVPYLKVMTSRILACGLKLSASTSDWENCKLLRMMDLSASSFSYLAISCSTRILCLYMRSLFIRAFDIELSLYMPDKMNFSVNLFRLGVTFYV